MTGVWIAVIALLGTVATGLGTWLVARRDSSGTVATSEAATLWAESQTIRRELRDEISQLRGSIDTLRTEVRNCHDESAQLQVRLAALEHRR